MRNRVDRADIFPAAKCGGPACGKKWTPEVGGWCRGCNGVYCTDHVDMKAHNCKRTDEIRGKVGSSLEGKTKRKRKKRANSSPASPKDTQLMLGDNPSGNGKTHG